MGSAATYCGAVEPPEVEAPLLAPPLVEALGAALEPASGVIEELAPAVERVRLDRDFEAPLDELTAPLLVEPVVAAPAEVSVPLVVAEGADWVVEPMVEPIAPPEVVPVAPVAPAVPMVPACPAAPAV